MDVFERRNLKRRKPTFVEQVKITDDFVVQLQAKGLWERESTVLILREKSNSRRVTKLFDVLMKCESETAFDTFCACLTLEHGWLSKELQEDVNADRGSLEIDEDVLNEAGMLVHRKFGTSKRLSELDKKEMQELIAVKIQISKEEWKQELDLVREELRTRTDDYKAKEKAMKTLIGVQASFIRDHEHDLTTRAHGMRTTSDVLRTAVADDDFLGSFREMQQTFLHRVQKVMKERDLLYSERERCKKVLNVSDDSMPLYEAAQEVVHRLPKQLEKSNQELDKRDQVIKKLTKAVDELELESQRKEEKLRQMDDALVDSTRKLQAAHTQEKDSSRDDRQRNDSPVYEANHPRPSHQPKTGKNTKNGAPRSARK